MCRASLSMMWECFHRFSLELPLGHMDTQGRLLPHSCGHLRHRCGHFVLCTNRPLNEEGRNCHHTVVNQVVSNVFLAATEPNDTRIRLPCLTRLNAPISNRRLRLGRPVSFVGRFRLTAQLAQVSLLHGREGALGLAQRHKT